MAKAPHPIGGADSRPRIYLAQRLHNGVAFGWWGRMPPEHCEGHRQLTVPLALQDALASVGDVPAVIMWLGRERAL